MRLTVLFLISACLNYSQGTPLLTTTETGNTLEPKIDVTSTDGALDTSMPETPEDENEIRAEDEEPNDNQLIDEQQKEQNDSLQNEQPHDEGQEDEELDESQKNEEQVHEQQVDEQQNDGQDEEEKQIDQHEHEEVQEDEEQKKDSDKLNEDEKKNQHNENQLDDEQQKDEEQDEEPHNGPKKDEEDVSDGVVNNNNHEKDYRTEFKPDRTINRKVIFNSQIQEDKSSTKVPIEDEEEDVASLNADVSVHEKDEKVQRKAPPQEESSHFFTYLVFTALLVAALYIGYHNKRKIIHFIIGARTSRASRRPNSADYQKLDYH